MKNPENIVPWMAQALPMPTPRESLLSARTNGLPARLDDPRFEQWSPEVRRDIYTALAEEGRMRLVQGVTFAERDSCAYPTIQQAHADNPGVTVAVFTGMIASVANYLRPKVTFRDERDYIEAFEHLRTQWGNFTLADYGLIFDRLRRGDLADLRFRFLLPELMKACEAYADTKCDRVEEREKLMKRYRNTDHYNDWNALTEMMGGAEAKRTNDRVKWMKGEDVMSWADKAKLAARDSARRNGDEQ